VSKLSSAKGAWRHLASVPRLTLALILGCPAPVIRGQDPSTFGMIVEGKFTVGLPDRSPQVVEGSEIAKLPHQTVKAKGSDSKTSVYSGVPLKELLQHVGVVFSRERQQRNLGSIVLVESVDATSALFAMAELDTALTDKRILLADAKDGKPLTAPEVRFESSCRTKKNPRVGRNTCGRSISFRFPSHPGGHDVDLTSVFCTSQIERLEDRKDPENAQKDVFARADHSETAGGLL
jgi:Oxidoreductase molybdopterin binding domain